MACKIQSNHSKLDIGFDWSYNYRKTLIKSEYKPSRLSFAIPMIVLS